VQQEQQQQGIVSLRQQLVLQQQLDALKRVQASATPQLQTMCTGGITALSSTGGTGSNGNPTTTILPTQQDLLMARQLQLLRQQQQQQQQQQ
jgi:hypothetical protein